MLKYIILCLACHGSISASLMGLGKQYTNKPAYFHHTFYGHKASSHKNMTPTINVVAQKETVGEERKAS